MTVVLVIIIAVLAAALAALAVYHLGSLRRRPAAAAPRPGTRRILFPFVASALSQRALDAALRLARAEDATLLPVFLARVPLTLPLESPLPRQASVCLPLQEAIEQRAAAFGVPVDARVERGRTYRHALRRTIAAERFERIVMAAASDGGPGFGARRRGLAAGPCSRRDRGPAPGRGGSAAAEPSAPEAQEHQRGRRERPRA